MASSAPKFLIDWFKQAWGIIQPDVMAFIEKQFEKWMPKVILAASVAMEHIGTNIANSALRAGAEGVSEIEENITQAIPGQLDDQVSDALVRPIIDRLRNFGINLPGV